MTTGTRADLDADFAAALDPVKAWASDAAGLPVVFDEGDAHDGKGAVLLRPLAVAVAPATGPVLRQVSSAEITLSVLATVVGLDAYEAAAATSALALSAQITGEWQIVPEAPDTALWQALGQPPVPAVVLRIPVRHLIERVPAPLVREPLHRTFVPLRVATGRVVWPDGRPIGGARVVFAEAEGPAAITDHRGRFRVPLATDADRLTVSITARGSSVELRLPASGSGAGGDLGDLEVPVPTGK